MNTVSSIRARTLCAVVFLGMVPLDARQVGVVLAQGIAPIVVVETSKGSFSFETFPTEAPLTVAHIVELVKNGFYNGQRVHRALPGFLIQFGDPQTNDRASRPLWGRGTGAASGKPIGVAEITKKRTNRKGAVGVAHPSNPAKADSQIYVTLADRQDLDGQYAVFGRIVDGAEVPALLEVGDMITRVFVKP